MNLENTFYTFGIIFMSLNILILIGIAVLIFYIKGKVSDIHRQIEEKIEDINDMAIKPVKRVMDVASSFMGRSKKSSRS